MHISNFRLHTSSKKVINKTILKTNFTLVLSNKQIRLIGCFSFGDTSIYLYWN